MQGSRWAELPRIRRHRTSQVVPWKRVRLAVVGAAIAVGLFIGFREYLRATRLTHNFRTVLPSRIYAGGFQYPQALQEILNRFHIKTIVSLLPCGEVGDSFEQDLASASGARFIRLAIPLPTETTDRYDSHPDAFKMQLTSIRQAVSILADPTQQPVYVHCVGGMHRTGTVVAIFRVEHCGWSEARARDELEKWGGTAGQASWPGEILHAYCCQPMLSKPDL